MEEETKRGTRTTKRKSKVEVREIMKERRMKQEKEINQLKETTRLENEEHERRWDRKENEFETDQLKKRARLEYTEMEKLRKDNEQLKRLGEKERLKWEGKWSQEVEPHNNVGCVISPQGVMLVVRNLIGHGEHFSSDNNFKV